LHLRRTCLADRSITSVLAETHSVRIVFTRVKGIEKLPRRHKGRGQSRTHSCIQQIDSRSSTFVCIKPNDHDRLYKLLLLIFFSYPWHESTASHKPQPHSQIIDTRPQEDLRWRRTMRLAPLASFLALAMVLQHHRRPHPNPLAAADSETVSALLPLRRRILMWAAAAVGHRSSFFPGWRLRRHRQWRQSAVAVAETAPPTPPRPLSSRADRDCYTSTFDLFMAQLANPTVGEFILCAGTTIEIGRPNPKEGFGFVDGDYPLVPIKSNTRFKCGEDGKRTYSATQNRFFF